MFAALRRLWRRWFGRSRRPVVDADRLGEVVAGIQRAAADSHGLVAEQYRDYLHRFFDDDDHGGYRARTVEVGLPAGGRVRVPLFALVRPRELQLERLRVAFSVAGADRDAIHRAITEAGTSDEPMRVRLDPRPGEAVMDVELTVRAGAVPAHLQRCIDESCAALTRALDPAPPGEDAG